MFVVDASDSVGAAAWHVGAQFVKDLVASAIPASSRAGVTRFAGNSSTAMVFASLVCLFFL